jgi:hypothetical protein
MQSLHYMAKVQNKDIFRFCAIPQVMAIATLAEIYNNPKVFRGDCPPCFRLSIHLLILSDGHASGLTVL